MSTTIEIRNLCKHYKPFAFTRGQPPVTKAVDNISLTIPAGSLSFLLGPSGCGKTTLLRMIAGFIEPTSGQILFNGRDVSRTPPAKRNTGMVFQSYALWPHMTVAQNVAFGLSVRKVPRPEREQRVMEALKSVRMDPYAARKPNQLSGGQQQRVALARALVVRPEVLLLDEPLSNLDAKLRLEMRSEIRRLCTQTGITTVYVTHDQKEALSMADRVAVLDMGTLAQVGGPRELYERPATRFVADFLGETNFLPAKVLSSGAETRLGTEAGELTSRVAPPNASGSVTCSIRPESWRILDDRTTPTAGPGSGPRLTGSVVESIYLGEMAQHIVDLDRAAGATGAAASGSLRVKVFELHPSEAATRRKRITLSVDPADVVVLPG